MWREIKLFGFRRYPAEPSALYLERVTNEMSHKGKVKYKAHLSDFGALRMSLCSRPTPCAGRGTRD